MVANTWITYEQRPRSISRIGSYAALTVKDSVWCGSLVYTDAVTEVVTRCQGCKPSTSSHYAVTLNRAYVLDLVACITVRLSPSLGAIDVANNTGVIDSYHFLELVVDVAHEPLPAHVRFYLSSPVIQLPSNAHVHRTEQGALILGNTVAVRRVDVGTVDINTVK